MALTLAVVAGIAGAVIGGVTGIVGGVASHQQQKQASKIAERNAQLQQAQMEYNQRVEEREAAALEAETAENARRQRIEAERLRGAQIAMLGKSGAALTSGSPLAVLGATAANEELTVQDIHYQGARGAAARRSQAVDYQYGASIARHNVSAARSQRPTSLATGLTIAGSIGSSLLQIGSTAGSYYNLKNR